jgi:ectoine hydroxylase-related dioxygenase (phytanoyl-CoA dioxygenase family)
MKTAPTKLLAGGNEIDQSPERFGWLRESNDAVGDFEELQRRMDADGYLFIRDFHPRVEIEAVRSEIMAAFAAEGLLDPTFPIADGRHIPDQNPYFRPDLAKKNEKLLRVVYGPRMMAFYSGLLGAEAMHYDFTWFRAIGKGGGTMPHCDVVYMGRGTHQLYTAWVPYGDIPLEVGGLVVVEGSHRWSELDAYRSMDVDTACQNVPGKSQTEASGHGFGVYEPKVTDVLEKFDARLLTCEEYRMGDLLTFNVHLLHGSLDNQQNVIRISSDTRYQLASEPVDERWIGEEPPAHGGSSIREMIC